VAVTSSIDDELNQFERDIRQLKIEYDQYFGGGRKRPPTEIEWRLEMFSKRYAERGGELKFGQRFRYNNLTQTYAKYKDIFRKRLQQKEEGKVQRHFGAAAKKIETERAQKAAEAQAAAAAADATAEAAATVANATASTGSSPAAFRMVCSKPKKSASCTTRFYKPSRKPANPQASSRAPVSTNS
jgi:hypothetical protein